MTITVFIILIAIVAGYGLMVRWLATRWTLPELQDETVRVALPSGRHHIALHHHAPSKTTFEEPVILCHGLGANGFNMDFTDDGSGSDRSSLARALCRDGFDTWVLELRGRGRTGSRQPGLWTASEEVQEDVNEAIAEVKARTGAARVFWVAHSWGGVLQYIRLSRGARDVAGAVMIGSPGGMMVYRSLRWLLEPGGRLLEMSGLRIPLRFAARASLPIVELVRFFGRLFFVDLRTIDGPVVRRLFASMIEDIHPGVLGEAAGWLAPGAIIEKNSGDEITLQQIDTPLLLIAGSRDRIAPAQSMAYVRDQVSTNDVRLAIMGKDTGCADEYSHGGLLLARNAPLEIFPMISNWIVQRATAAIEITARAESDDPGSVRTDPEQNSP